MLHFAFQAPNKPSPTPLIPHLTSSPRLQTHWAPCCSLQGSTRCLGWAPPPAPLAGMLLPQPPRVLPSPPPPPRAGSAHVQTPPKQQACSPVPLLGLVSRCGVCHCPQEVLCQRVPTCREQTIPIHVNGPRGMKTIRLVSVS